MKGLLFMGEIILVGYGGHAKSVADCIIRQKEYCIVGYTDLKEHDSPYKYFGSDSVLEAIYEQGIRSAALCIGYLGNGDIREKLYRRLKEIGFHLPAVIDPSAIVSKTAEIEEGAFIGKNTIINAESKIGKLSIINTGAIIEHECKVHDFAHIAAGAVLCGKVTVGNAALVGAGVSVIQGRTIGRNAIIGAGGVVTSDIPDECTAVGIPAKVIKNRSLLG